MSESSWKIVAASVAGTSHAAKNVLCQDSFAWQVVGLQNEILIVVVADGAGSAKNALIGAETTCRTMLAELGAFAEKNAGIKNLAREHVLEWIKLLQTQFQILAEAEKSEKSDFACTLLVAVIENDTAVFIQIGDGGMVYKTAAAANEYQLVIKPQQGEYANTTNFVTNENAGEVLKFEKLEKQLDEIAIFTDGLQRIALDYQTNTAHAPFFRPMFAPLGAEKVAENLAAKLREFLASPKINERTDDDKTLILAARRR